jgi:hypothetical protein
MQQQPATTGQFESDSYLIEWGAKGMAISTTEYHVGPIDLSWPRRLLCGDSASS